jgi:predicted aspartyl protease
MIRGRLATTGEPLVPLTLRGTRSHRIEAVLDTGFTGHLCLARRYRRLVGLVRLGMVEAELADGSRVAQAVYLGTVSFGRRLRSVLVTFTASNDSLVGTALLRDERVTIDFARGGVMVRRSRRARRRRPR